MKIRTKFIIFFIAIHSIFLYLIFQLWQNDKIYFIVGEGLVFLSIAFSIWFIVAINRALNLISNGIESLKDKDFNTRLSHTGHSEMDALISVYNQMIDQLREERIKFTEKNFFLEKLIQASPSAIIVLGADQTIDTLNPSAEKLLGLADQILGAELEALQGYLPAELIKLNDGEAKIIYLNGMQIYNCQKSHFIDKGFSHNFFIIEELTEEIHRREKNAYEKVIRVMSHEVNNSIGAINSILHSCLSFKNQLHAQDADDYGHALTVSIGRNESLIHFMSNFAKVIRIPEPQKQSFDIHKLIQSIRPIIEVFALEKEITWEWNFRDNPFIIQADQSQMEQVLINVFKNAVESIAQKGRISTTTYRTSNTLTIEDTGQGINDEDRLKLFFPFFSTKKNGQGIGLTLIKEILLNHSFRFSLENRENTTVFKIIFIN